MISKCTRIWYVLLLYDNVEVTWQSSQASNTLLFFSFLFIGWALSVNKQLLLENRYVKILA